MQFALPLYIISSVFDNSPCMASPYDHRGSRTGGFPSEVHGEALLIHDRRRGPTRGRKNPALLICPPEKHGMEGVFVMVLLV